MGFFTIRVFKSWGVRDPERRWVNTYEIADDGVTNPIDAEAHMDRVVLAERAIHLKWVQFLSATISTWTPDSEPYNPDAFNTYELTGVGSRDFGSLPITKALDSNVCYIMKRQCVSGRSGRLFYRGCLYEEDVEMGGDGRFAMALGVEPGPSGAAFTAYHTAMLPLLAQPEEGPGLALISIIGAVRWVRPVTDLIVGGITISRRNHRYFDRAPSV